MRFQDFLKKMDSGNVTEEECLDFLASCREPWRLEIKAILELLKKMRKK